MISILCASHKVHRSAKRLDHTFSDLANPCQACLRVAFNLASILRLENVQFHSKRWHT